MIITLDLSMPRKITYNLINNIIFELRMRDIKLRRYDNIVLLSLLLLLLKDETAIASETGLSGNFLEGTDIWKLIEPYGIPTAQLLFDALKIAVHTKEYSKLCLANILKSITNTNS